MQIDQRHVVVGAVRRLIQPLAPKGKGAWRGAEDLGCLPKIVLRDVANLRNPLWRVLLYSLFKFLPALGVLADESFVASKPTRRDAPNFELSSSIPDARQRPALPTSFCIT